VNYSILIQVLFTTYHCSCSLPLSFPQILHLRFEMSAVLALVCLPECCGAVWGCAEQQPSSPWSDPPPRCGACQECRHQRVRAAWTLPACPGFAARALGHRPLPSPLLVLFLRNAGFYAAHTMRSLCAVPVGSAGGGVRLLRLSPGCRCHQSICIAHIML